MITDELVTQYVEELQGQPIDALLAVRAQILAALPQLEIMADVVDGGNAERWALPAAQARLIAISRLVPEETVEAVE